MHIELMDSLQSAALALPMEVENPLDDVNPEFSVFGSAFNAWWKKVLGALWALALLWAIVNLIISVAAASQAKGGHPNDLAEARKGVFISLVVLGALAALAVLVGAILAVAG